MHNIIIKNIQDEPYTHKSEHPDYEYKKQQIVGRGSSDQCIVSVYEIPPGKAAYPFHYHTKNEEVFFIIKGCGKLRTPEGEQLVGEGDFMFFSANGDGAHKLINISETEPLVYIDFDTKNDIDVAIYPDSNKIGIWGKDINRLYNMSSAVDYYENE